MSWVRCPVCKGTGVGSPRFLPCDMCDGTGEVFIEEKKEESKEEIKEEEQLVFVF